MEVDRASGSAREIDSARTRSDVIEAPLCENVCRPGCIPLEDTWEEDRKFRMKPEVTTALLREQVPILDFVKWSVTSIEPGEAKSRLPLNPESTNQHFTHQGALFVLAGEYTGGIALGSLLWGWPVLGVHPVTSRRSVSLWLAKVEIKYIQPSVGELTIESKIAPDRHDRIRQRFLEGRPVVESVQIHFVSGGQSVAEASATYYLLQSERLRSEAVAGDRLCPLGQLRFTSSAEMIAGVRALENGRLFNDPFAESMAGEHGLAVASRMCQKLPQLGRMVASRTAHLDSAIREFFAGGGRQLVLVRGWLPGYP